MSLTQSTPFQLNQWWADAVIYQIYPRSFSDADSNGVGDLQGVRRQLPYLEQLGVDAIWLSPFYLSPQADAGYDVADYRVVDPLFGDMNDFDGMLADAHSMGIRVIVDLVPNHTSDNHEWFREALTAAPGSEARERYMFRDGSGENGELPPNNWQSIFGGDAWTQVDDDQWYLHLFDTRQPDLNWENPEVREEMESVLRFWLDRGVDGFRIDVAHGLIKADGLPDWDTKSSMVEGSGNTKAPPYFDQDEVHEIYRSWNKVLSAYDGDRMLVAEAWVEPAERLFRYVRPDEMQQAFNFGFLLAGWDAARMASSVEESLEEAGKVRAPATWVLSNHDTVRHSTRYGLLDPTTFPKGISAANEQPDEDLGLARGRAAALTMLALPGSAYIYQGDELGLPEHTTLDASVRQDPAFLRTNGEEIGRDGCRVPIPWTADAPGYGFSAGAPDSVSPWLPQPDSFARYAADQQVGVEGSTHDLYRKALSVRAERKLGQGTLTWTNVHAPSDGVLSYRNGGLTVLVNTGTDAVELPQGAGVVLVSQPDAISNGSLQPNGAVWLV
ncbi:glycoside hydrolase family 13 protein [Arthrobacter roseus]|uniref:glycoside hydrolase family 13 protein n=1 Tax=Arthrobacter roseus TaxID=136274 RepID=UPI0019640058|nr:glycoside hydrolase family 13 protein [Arthrobacter roseus]MBM7847369.1 alpha-glucosidase [Arthrobacter roseus]